MFLHRESGTNTDRKAAQPGEIASPPEGPFFAETADIIRFLA